MKCRTNETQCLKKLRYGIDCSLFVRKRNHNSDQSLRVLFVGSVRLQKGIQYLLKAVALLKTTVKLRVVGPVVCNTMALKEASGENVEILGAVPHHEISKQYNWADVFCLPSLAEGSAMVTYEALASGLPVICTPNTGSVVCDSINGYIVPTRDSNALASTLTELVHNRHLLRELKENARNSAQEFSLPKYSTELTESILQFLKER